MAPSLPSDVVITGIGVVTADAATPAALWDRIVAQGDTPVGLHHSTVDVDVLAVDESAGIDDFSRRDLRRLARSTRLALVAARRAVSDAGDPDVDPDRGAVAMATAANGAMSLVEDTRRFDSDDDDVGRFLSCRMTGSQRATAVAAELGWRGPCQAPATACAAGNDAIAGAVELLRSGRCDVVLAGGTDAPLSEPWIASMHRLGVVAADGRCRPFDGDRHGFLMAEGAAACVLERRDRAEARGATIHLTVAGWHATCDAYHIANPAPGGEAAWASMQGALVDAGLDVADLGWYYAHATGTVANDLVEAALVAERVPDLPVVATKSVTGHPFAATAVLEIAVVAEAFRRGALPPIAGLDSLDPAMASIDVVTSERAVAPAPAVSTAFGLGGVNTSVVLLPPA